MILLRFRSAVKGAKSLRCILRERGETGGAVSWLARLRAQVTTGETYCNRQMLSESHSVCEVTPEGAVPEWPAAVRGEISLETE